MPAEETPKIHAIVFRDGEWLVAQCLEYDIATQARDLKGLFYEVERILAAHVLIADRDGAEPFAGIPRAPKRFWEMYKGAAARIEPVHSLTFPVERLPQVELRQAA
jgi:hypothetical protein